MAQTSEGTYPDPELLSILLERAHGRPINLSIHVNVLLPILTRHEIFSKVRELDLVLLYLIAPGLCSLSMQYGGAGWIHQIRMLKALAPHLRKLELCGSGLEFEPLTETCTTSFLALTELSLLGILPQGCAPFLIQTPNIEYLYLMHYGMISQSNYIHWLSYVLSSDGMLGPIRALKRLRLLRIPLVNKVQPDYFTCHLRLHSRLEYLEFKECELPVDFLELMLQLANSLDGFLPKLKELSFEDCTPMNPSREWRAQLATNWPLVMAFYHSSSVHIQLELIYFALISMAYELIGPFVIKLTWNNKFFYLFKEDSVKTWDRCPNHINQCLF
ncbi:hypothetical protein CPB86DRAFT_799217 [Serendipita vermifera]|nr:hypothetical protein CPB86DRAFT_799217 [Serendipita vermifera]